MHVYTNTSVTGSAISCHMMSKRSTMCSVVTIVAMFASGCSQETTTNRPAIHFCQFAGDLVKVLTDTLEQFKTAHQEAMVEGEKMKPFSTGSSRFSFPFATIHSGELHNAHNLYIAEGSNINCDEKQMNVKINFGIRDPIIAAKFSTPFGIDGDAVIKMKQFEADVTAVLPRSSNRIEIKKVAILAMEDLKVDIKTESANSKIDFSQLSNAFLKTTPKGMLYPLIGSFVKRFAQQYLDENPLPF